MAETDHSTQISPPRATEVHDSHANAEPIRVDPRWEQLERGVLPWLQVADGAIYMLISLVFLIAALGMLIYSVVAFRGGIEGGSFPLAVVALVNDLLLVMIIMEVLRTVLSYLEARGSSLEPFLFIAAISATRRILAIGAQMSVTGDTLTPERFQQAMIDLGANAAAILAVALALFLLRRVRPIH